MKLGLNLQASLQQTLTPQQIQYLKLLQLTALQFEQHVRSEVETNPMLEDAREIEDRDEATDATIQTRSERAQPYTTEAVSGSEEGSGSGSGPESGSDTKAEALIPDDRDGFEFYKLIWGEDPSSARTNDFSSPDEEDDEGGFQFRDVETLEDDLLEQIRYLPISAEERLFAEYVVGNVDTDGYLRRDLDELVSEVNAMMAGHNLALQAPELLGTRSTGFERDRIPGIDTVLEPLTLKQADAVIGRVQALDPPGFASRSVQECLVAQLRSLPRKNAAEKLALLVLTKAYEAFAMKHYHVIERQLEVTEEYLREAIDVIRRLNPRPGGGSIGPEVNTLVPDFSVERTEDRTDVQITVNDSRLPTLRVSNAYEKLKQESKNYKFNKETREFLRKKYEDAKFLIQAIRQRKSTMLRVMTAIAGLQHEFFLRGPEHLRPLIYRDVSEVTGLDISTVCRIVNGKYVQTDFGTFELKYFFSESMETADGDEVSTRIIKQKLKELIDAESKRKPLSDDKLGSELQKLGYNVARRTVAKYREQLRIPVARLRKEL
ncbi:MAG: RNA polymerase factor sigma-54 [Candidatus Kapaibacteriota bacterium]